MIEANCPPAPGSAGYRCNCGWRGTSDQLSTVRGYRDRCPKCGAFAMSDRFRALIAEIVEATPPNNVKDETRGPQAPHI